MKKNFKPLVLFSLFFTGLLHLKALAHHDSLYLSDLPPLLIECVESSRKEACMRALSQLEMIQREAAEKNNYSCQSHALGLGAELIMITLNVDRAYYAYLTLEKVNELCDGI